MQSWRIRFLFAAIAGAVTVQPAAADPIVVGAPGNSASCVPFGCRDSPRYQQVYSADLFPGVFTIQTIAFPYTIDRMSNLIDPAVYEIRLSTTSRQVGALSADFDANVGGDATLVFAGPLAGEVPRGGALSFTLPTPFVFDPGNGNLLLDVAKQGGIFFGDDGIYLDHNTEMGGRSSNVFSLSGQVHTMPTWGLVTSFSGDVAPVPEPTTMLLFGTGAAGGLLARRRRQRRAESLTD